MHFGPAFVQRVLLAFILLQILSLVFDGLFLGATDYGTLKTLTWFTSQGFSTWLVPIVAFGSFILALPQMMIWDYAWFASLGNFGSMLRVILAAATMIGFVWGFATMLWPIIAQVFVAVIRGVTGLIGRFF